MHVDLSYASYRTSHLAGRTYRHQTCENHDLDGYDFSHSDLQKSVFYVNSMRRVTFQSADLRGAVLACDDFTDADFRDVRMERSTVRDLTFRRCRFTGADLSKSRLIDIELFGCDLRGANLDKILFVGCRYDAETRWPEGFTPSSADCHLVTTYPDPGPFDFTTTSSR
jgi:uncharacterized protein YjbI with pentapeptide repeats